MSKLNDLLEQIDLDSSLGQDDFALLKKLIEEEKQDFAKQEAIEFEGYMSIYYSGRPKLSKVEIKNIKWHYNKHKQDESP
jgi:hypothetical protein